MSGQSLVAFDRRLLKHIKSNRNVKAKSMLSKDLAKARDKFGTLLHYAARYGNEVITKYLIELGSDVDAIGKDDMTPLVVAVNNLAGDIVKILLEANADIDIADDSGESALQIAFKDDGGTWERFDMYIYKVLAHASSIEESVSKLVNAGCTLYHATFSKDVKILECMLARGFDINSQGPWQQTALHAAAQLDDLELAKWLVDRGADVNALLENGVGPLFFAVEDGKKEMVQFLLERGANPNTNDLYGGYTPLSKAVENSTGSDQQYVECVELLLHYGAAIPPYVDGSNIYTIIDCALQHENLQIVNMLICHVAVLEKLGTSVAESVIRCIDDDYLEELGKIKKDYELCLQTLDVTVVGTSTLIDLLVASEEQMKVYVRNETFLLAIKEFCFKLSSSELYSYYYNQLTRSVARADHLIKLENTAIPVICDLFDGDYNQCYVAARKVCGYLNEPDLVHLGRL